LAAGRLADANKTTFESELLSLSIVSVNEGHYPGTMAGWNLKAQNAAGAYFTRLNGVPEKELDDKGEVIPE
jgi:hypothetical protein